MKPVLRTFNQSYFGGLSARVEEKKKELAAVQLSILNSASQPDLMELEKSLTLELYDLLIAEESYFRQKSRINWIHEGDQNTSFFQKIVAARQNKSTIRALTDANGVQLTTFSQISNEAVSFFQNLLGARDSNVVNCQGSILEELLDFSISEEVAAVLCSPVTAEEIKNSMFSIGNEKAPWLFISFF